MEVSDELWEEYQRNLQENPKGAYDIDPSPDQGEGKGKALEFVAKSAGVGRGTVEMFNYIEEKDLKLADALCKGSYDECGNKITIGGVYKDLIPPLADHEKEGLEEDIKHFGCYCPITTWEGTIIDGHHRYEICSRHKLSFLIEEREFETQNDAEIWIIQNQFNRRNLPLFTRGTLVFELEKRMETRRGENQHTKESGSVRNQTEAHDSHEWPTRKAAKAAGMGHDSYAKCKFIDKHATEEDKKKLHKNETSANQVYNRIKTEKMRTEIITKLESIETEEASKAKSGRKKRS